MRSALVWTLIGLIASGMLAVPKPTDAQEGKWTRKADMPTARAALATAAVNGKILAMGGWNNDGYLKTVEVYDPATDTWMQKAGMPEARGLAGIAVIKRKIYVIGGFRWPPLTTLKTVFEYDPIADTWTQKADMPEPRSDFGASVVNGKIYVIGGYWQERRQIFSTVLAYDPVTDTWTKKAEMKIPRLAPATVVVDGKIYAIGGYGGAPGKRKPLWSVEAYHPLTDTWERKAKMPAARTNLTATAVDGKIYAIGGVTNLAVARQGLSTVEVYAPQTDTWTKEADMPTPRFALSTSVVDGKIYAIGGSSNGRRFSTVEEYTPPGWPFAVSPKGKLTTMWGEIKAND